MSACPTESVLRNYMLGSANTAELGQVAAHLDDCAMCRSWVDRALAEETSPAGGNDGNTRGAAPKQSERVAAAPEDRARSAVTPPRIGPYEILRRLNRGGQGVVYLARHGSMRRQVALKVLPRQYASHEAYLRRFRREAQAAARLSHPNVVTVFESGYAAGVHYIAMEYVDGQALSQALERRLPLNEPQIVEVGLAVLGALDHAHDKGVLHRDIKPGNILLTRTGDVKLTDFGLAKTQETLVSFLTTEGNMLGTPAFISPEQAQGHATVDHRSDLYSLGCVIYNMASGRPPFTGDNAFVIMDQHRRVEPEPVRSVNPRISEALATVITRAMSKVPDSRYASAREMADHLEMIRQALHAPDRARGGLAQIVQALDQINIVGRQIQEARSPGPRPGWQARLTVAFLRRPMFWFTILAGAFLAAIVVAFWLGTLLGAG